MPAGLHSAGTPEFVHSDTPVRPSPTALTAFVGRTLKGPVDHPVAVANFAQYTQHFGGLCPESPLSYAVEQFFEHGGRTALIVRVVNGGRPPTLDLPAGEGWLSFAGRSPGRAEHLRAAVDHDGIPPGDAQRFNLVVQQVRERRSERIIEQEIYRGVSLGKDGPDHIARALESSRLVRLAGALPDCRPEPTRVAEGVQTVGYVSDNGDGDDGRALDDYDLIGSESLRRGLFALEGQAFNFLCIPPLDRGRDPGSPVWLAASAFCRRHHALLIVDPPEGWRSSALALAGLRDAPFRAPEALMCYPRIETFDRLAPGQSVNFASCGVFAGLLAAADAAAPAWWNAAAFQLPVRPGCRPATSVSASEALQFAALGVNAFQDSRQPSLGALPLRALQGTQAASGLPPLSLRARRLLAWVAQSIERATRWASRERDEPDVGERACHQVLQFLERLVAEGAFESVGLPTRPFVICDGSLNDLATAVRGEFRMVYGLDAAPGRGAPIGWLLVQKASGSRTQPVPVNPYALRSRA